MACMKAEGKSFRAMTKRSWNGRADFALPRN
jgi:hypothetical protein